MIRCWLVTIVFVLPCGAQALPDRPNRAFFDPGNRIRLLALAGLLAADGVTTHHVLFVDGGREMNPLARPLVTRGAGGQVAASFLGYGIAMGMSYLFHKSGHHKIGRMVLNLAIGVESECVADNLIQVARADRSALRAGQAGARSTPDTGFFHRTPTFRKP